MAEEVLDQGTAQPAQGDSATPAEGNVEAEGKGEQQPNWVSSIPKDYREKVTGYESMSAFMADALDAVDARGRAVVRPSGDAAPEEWAEFWKSVGRPDSPDGYEFQLPEGVELDTDLAKAFREKAFASGLTSQQAKQLFDWYSETQLEQSNRNVTEANEKVEKELRDEWGADYDKNLQTTVRAMKKFSPEGFDGYLEETGLGSDPRMVKLFYNIGKAVSQDKGVFGQSAAGKTDEEVGLEMYPSHKNKGWV